MQARHIAIGALLACLTSCASAPAHDARPETDLQALDLGVQALTRERQPQASKARVEDVETQAQLEDLALALEDVNWLQNDDKRRTRWFVAQSVRRIQLSRLPTCSWYEISCKRRRHAIEAQIQAATLAPLPPPELAR